jgi:hypothetical protein
MHATAAAVPRDSLEKRAEVNTRPGAPIGASRSADRRRYEVSMNVISFPRAARDRREHLLRVAASAAPLLEAAVASGNASMIERIFEALGAFARRDDDAVERLALSTAHDAQVVALR